MKNTEPFINFVKNNFFMKRPFLKTSIIDRMTVIDGDSGEILEQREKKYKYLAKNKEEFFIIYTSLIGVFKKLSNPGVKVYCYLLENYNIGTCIAISTQLRGLIGKDLKLGSGTVANTLTELMEKKLIYNVDWGIYKLNPRYAFQGSTADRDKLLRVVLEVECPEC